MYDKYNARCDKSFCDKLSVGVSHFTGNKNKLKA